MEISSVVRVLWDRKHEIPFMIRYRGGAEENIFEMEMLDSWEMFHKCGEAWARVHGSMVNVQEIQV
jgi:hypothetical protein